jgi:hypothetical protein
MTIPYLKWFSCQALYSLPEVSFSVPPYSIETQILGILCLFLEVIT